MNSSHSERAGRKYLRHSPSLCPPWLLCLAALAAGLPLSGALAAQTTTVPPAPAVPATTVTTQAVQVSPASAAWVLYRKGRDNEYMGRTQTSITAYTQAIARSEQVIASNPNDMEAHVVRTFSLFRLGRHQDVLTRGKEALKIAFDPRISEILGEASYMLGQDAEAIAYMRKYIETLGDSAEYAPNAYYYTAEAYMRLKQYAHADIAFSIAVAKAPSMSRWWYRLGLACELQGQFRRAYDAFVKCLALNPRSEDAKAGRDRVKAKAGV